MKPETILQKQAQDLLERAGFWVIPMAVSGKRSNRSVRTGEPGLPDLCLPELGWLEAKTEDGKLSPEQLAWHERARRAGIWVDTFRSAPEALKLALGRRQAVQGWPQ